ncbi:MAG TPA: hypothetical protein VHH55_09385 [Gaiellaceae bacterium]|nr:hypothetical protein [Gaiellaceae bacterium]
MRAVAAAAAVSAALVAGYLALGGASYAPAKVADPCVTRDWREPNGFQEVAEQIILSALDGAACELGTSREEIVLALDDRESLEQFARDQGVGTDELERLARSGLVRAVDDAQQAGSLEAETARVLRDLARRIPLAQILELARFLR